MFSTGNDTYQIFCSADFKGFDLEDVHSDNLPECLAACSTYVPQRNFLGHGPSVGATWKASDAGGEYFRKNNASTSDVNSLVVSGRKTS